MITLIRKKSGSEQKKTKLHSLYELYRQPMYEAAYRILKDSYLAEDAVHNAFLKASECLSRIGSPEEKSSRNYLLILARNAALRIYNRNKKQIPTETVEEIVPDMQDVEVETESREVMRKVFELIYSLEPSYCDILLLKFYYEMEDAEIAQTLDISLNNARVRLHRAKTALKVKLKEVYRRDGI